MFRGLTPSREFVFISLRSDSLPDGSQSSEGDTARGIISTLTLTIRLASRLLEVPSQHSSQPEVGLEMSLAGESVIDIPSPEYLREYTGV